MNDWLDNLTPLMDAPMRHLRWIDEHWGDAIVWAACALALVLSVVAA